MPSQWTADIYIVVVYQKVNDNFGRAETDLRFVMAISDLVLTFWDQARRPHNPPKSLAILVSHSFRQVPLKLRQIGPFLPPMYQQERDYAVSTIVLRNAPLWAVAGHTEHVLRLTRGSNREQTQGSVLSWMALLDIGHIRLLNKG